MNEESQLFEEACNQIALAVLVASRSGAPDEVTRDAIGIVIDTASWAVSLPEIEKMKGGE